MTTILFGLGLVLVIEGLVLALLPNRLEDLLEALRSTPVEARRLMGLIAVACGAFLLWLIRFPAL